MAGGPGIGVDIPPGIPAGKSPGEEGSPLSAYVTVELPAGIPSGIRRQERKDRLAKLHERLYF